MRKKIIAVLAILMMLGGSGSWAWDGTESAKYQWGDKLTRGFLNVVSSPIEVPVQIYNTTSDKNLAIGWTLGLVQGLAQGFIRFSAGVIDIVTCPFDFPEAKKGPLIEPEFVWEKPGPKYV